MRTAIVLMALAMAFGAGAGVWLIAESRNNRLVWDHWDVVKRGILYRSGQLNPDQLDDAIKAYGLKTVVSLQLPGEGVAVEREVARRNGIDFLNLPMPGDGFGKESQFREILKAIDDPNRRPVLVHCARGTCRTGAAVALYRFERDGWTVADVATEMRRQTYREGWLPGYVYNMVKSRPAPERFEPDYLYDQNLPEPPKPSEKPTGDPISELEKALERENSHDH